MWVIYFNTIAKIGQIDEEYDSNVKLELRSELNIKESENVLYKLTINYYYKTSHYASVIIIIIFKT